MNKRKVKYKTLLGCNYIIPSDRESYFKMACYGKYQEVRLNSSKYFDTCWIKLSPYLENSSFRCNDTNFAYNEIQSWVAGLSIALESFTGTILNLLVIVALLRNSELRKEYMTPGIISMAITDFLFSVAVLPVMSLLFLNGDMLVSHIGLFSFFCYGLWFCSAWNLLGISILRCIALFYPYETKQPEFRRKTKFMIAMAWIIPFLFLVPTLYRKYGRFGLECRTMIPRIIPIDSSSNPTLTEPEWVLGSIMFIPGLLIIVLNIITYAQISKLQSRIILAMAKISEEKMRNLIAREKRIGLMVAIVSIAFFLVYFPTMVLRVMDENANITKRNATIFGYLINWSIGIIDPLVYIMCRKNYRNEIKSIFEAVFRCSNPSQICGDLHPRNNDNVGKKSGLNTISLKTISPKNSPKSSSELGK